ncbi:MAG TPA: sulfatase-like hydrolase/transferase [Polyangiaceae bacterium]|nr:sulfatase-like hydrolase/transferase [Polyangiaceae bacterium]
MQGAGRAAWFESDPETSSRAARAPAAAGVRAQLSVAAACVSASIAAAFVLVGADCTVREGFRFLSASDHLLGSCALYTVAGTLLGLLLTGGIMAEWGLVGRWIDGRSRWLQLLRPLFYAIIGGIAAIDTAVWTFSGEKAQASKLAQWGPLAFCVLVGLGTFVGSALLLRALRAARAGRPWHWLPPLVLFALLGGLGAYVDLTTYVMLYQRVHTIIELGSALCFAAVFALLIVWGAGRERRVVTVLQSLSTAALLWTGTTVASTSVRAWLDEKLRHVWLEEAYVGRMLWRFQIAEAFLSDPQHWRGLAVSRIERLRKRYQLADVSLDPRYKQPLSEPADFWGKLQTLRGGQQRYDIVVYYVDTLRNDVASDPKTMPHAVKFAGESLNFARTYAAGSDTLRSLPVLTGGNYDPSVTRPNDLIRVAKRSDYDSVLVIAKSAQEFLGKLRPEVHFDHTVAIQDHPAEQEVWGYGAQQPTSRDVVDAGLKVLRQKRNHPVLLWMFNFDQHNWRELDGQYVDDAVKKYGIAADPEQPAWRYRAVARSIDEQFGRFLAGLETDGRLKNTIIVFVSDHGEALGRDGFWVHSVFLWETLIRVPLIIKVPGIAPRRISDKVSLVDVAPTLSRFMDPQATTGGYQGEDLLGYLVPGHAPRRYPIFLQAASKDVLVRVGMVDPLEEYKLVLSLEAAFPELYDLHQDDPDAMTVTREQPARTLKALRALVRSPVFPRTAEDFDVRDTKEQKALAAGRPLPTPDLLE